MMAASTERCEICGKYAVDRHHIMTRGAHGHKAEHEANFMYLCREHHSMVHALGRSTFAEKFGLTERVLEARLVVKGY